MAKRKNSDQLSDRQSGILDVSVKLFGDKGYRGTSMRDIAEQVGVLPGSLYAHINSKEDILAGIVQEGIEGFLKIKETIESLDADPEEKLREAIKLHLKLVVSDRERTLVTIHQWRFLTEPNRSRAEELRRDYAQMFIDILDEGARGNVSNKTLNKKFNTKIQAFMILGALNWTTEWYSSDGPDSPEEIGENLAEIVINGMGL